MSIKRAMILAAGRGRRMGQLTANTPKPLLLVGGKPMITHHLAALKRAGIFEVVINLSYRGEQFEALLGDGSEYGVHITYSWEREQDLETGGGVLNALKLLGDEPFIVMNGDVWTNYPLQNLPDAPDGLAHLVLVDNPIHKPEGDFYLLDNRLHSQKGTRLTMSGLGVYHPTLFKNLAPGHFPLAPILREAVSHDQITGEHYQGEWVDIGTPERYKALNQFLNQKTTNTMK